MSTDFEPDVFDEAEGKKRPLQSWNLPGSPGGRIEVAVWQNEYQHNGETRIGFSCSATRSYKKDGDFEKKPVFRLMDLFVLQYAIQQAIDFMIEHQPKRSKD